MDMGLPPDTEHRFCRGKGCPACFGTGYRGRTGVFELLIVDRKLRSAISDGIGREELAALVRREGKFTSLADNCRRLVLEGVTTIEEARRITNSADYDYEN